MPLALPTHLSQRQALVLTALTSVIATSSLILTFQALRREHRTEKLKKQVGEDVEEWEKSRAGSGVQSPEEVVEAWNAEGSARGRREWKRGEFDEGLIREQLTRNYNFLGEEAMAKVRDSYVVVVGAGGVGSWAAVMLVRSGVGKIKIIDFDLTTLSSLNRHACATLEDVGTPKVVALQKFLKKVAPWVEVEVHVGLWRQSEEGEALLSGADWVVDAIDNIDTKADLLGHCHKNGIKVFSSMGSGAKQDPTRVQIADISSTYEDPLARSVRRRLRVKGVSSGIPVVYSTETPGEVKLLPLPEEEFQRGAVKELQAFDDFRVRILPVLGPLPAIFGLNIATWILLDLAGKPLTCALEIKNRVRTYKGLKMNLTEREARWQGLIEQAPIGLSNEDLGMIFEDVNLGKTTFAPHLAVAKPQAVRWDKGRELTEDNVVIMNIADAKRHEAECLKGSKSPEEVWGEEKCAVVRRRQDEVRKVVAYRNV